MGFFLIDNCELYERIKYDDNNKFKGIFLKKCILARVLSLRLRLDFIFKFCTYMCNKSKYFQIATMYVGDFINISSWGSGRAVSRISRFRESGTRLSGNAIKCNNCRGGKVFVVTNIWNCLHKKINKKLKVEGTVLTSSCISSILIFFGLIIYKIEEIPI